MKLALALIFASIASAQFFPFPGPGRTASGGGGGGGAIAYKASSYTENLPASTGTTVSNNSINIASGDTVLVCIGRGVGSSTISGVTDGGSNTFTKVGSTSTSTSDTVGAVDMWVKTNATANATATITATFNTSVTFRWIASAQYTGVATSSAVDQSSCAEATCTTTTSSTNVSAVNVTTTQANELLAYCGYNNAAANWTAANSFNLRTGTTGMDRNLADKVVSSTGSYPNGNIATMSASAGQVGVFGTFKAAP